MIFEQVELKRRKPPPLVQPPHPTPAPRSSHLVLILKHPCIRHKAARTKLFIIASLDTTHLTVIFKHIFLVFLIFRGKCPIITSLKARAAVTNNSFWSRERSSLIRSFSVDSQSVFNTQTEINKLLIGCKASQSSRVTSLESFI